MTGSSFLNILIVTFSLLLITSIFLISILIMRFFDHLTEAREKKFIAKWQDKLFDYASSNDKPKSFLKLISRLQYNNLLSYLRSLLFNLKGSDAEQLKALINEPKMVRFILSRLRSFKHKNRIRAIYFMRFINTPKIIDLLVSELKSTNELIFKTSIESLAQLNATEKIDIILDRIRKRKNLTAENVLLMISSFDKSICPIITKVLPNEKSLIIQQVLIAILWYHKYIEANKEVLEILSRSTDTNVILEAIRYLGETENPDALKILKNGLKSSRSEVRLATIESISKIGIGTLEDKIIDKFHDSEVAIKIAAARILLRQSDRGKKILFDLAKMDSNHPEVVIAKKVFIERRIFGNA